MPSGVEQLDEFPRLRIATCDIRTFKRVAIEASQAQVFGDRLAPVLLRNDVVDFKGEERIRLGKLAVLAGGVRPLPNEFNQRLLHRLFSPSVFLENEPSF
jgi:hypothetical protein